MAEVLIVPLEERINTFGSHYEQSKDLITAPEYKKNQDIIIYKPVAHSVVDTPKNTTLILLPP